MDFSLILETVCFIGNPQSVSYVVFNELQRSAVPRGNHSQSITPGRSFFSTEIEGERVLRFAKFARDFQFLRVFHVYFSLGMEGVG